MKIDGKQIAERILTRLAGEVKHLKEKRVVPTLAVILVGSDPASLSYINQKRKAIERIGAKITLQQFPVTIEPESINKTIEQYNNDRWVHGLIIQRPLPKTLKNKSIALHSVILSKDVDGLVPNSPFEVPVAAAVGEMLKEIYKSTNLQMPNDVSKINPPIGGQNSKFLEWLRTKNVAVIGRGETAGKPVADYLAKLYFTTSDNDGTTISPDFAAQLWRRRNNLQCAMSIIHSQTPNSREIMKKADIIISCVGKERVVAKDNLKLGTILIGVGIWHDREGKLHGDYQEEEIAGIASFYTPTPGGIGPVNVACLMQNLVKACTMSLGGN